MLKKYGYIRVGTIIPSLKVGNVEFNTEEIIKQIKCANKKGIQIVTTPELALTSATIGDLLFQDIILNQSLNGLNKILHDTKSLDVVALIGMPLVIDNDLYDTAVVINKGIILGVIPKLNANNRYFKVNNIDRKITLLGQETYFGNKILFIDYQIIFGVEFGDDLLSLNPPSNNYTLGGANIVFSLSSINEIVGNYEYIKNTIKLQSIKTNTAYVFANSGTCESTTDMVYAGHSFIVERGHVLEEIKPYNFNSSMIYADIDINLLNNNRYRQLRKVDKDYKYIDITIKDKNIDLLRKYNQYPFVPVNDLDKRCADIFNMQAASLAKRLEHIKTNKTVIGISGGLDSTLAFLVIVKSYKMLNIDNKNIIAITMPGFGTTDRTYQNAINLVNKYGATLKEISIKDACLIHFKDIEQDLTKHDITYENSQARERTQILMDVANKEGALVVGTGDLSELALGWCTYNGDHMSMYAVNCDIPKTLIRPLVKWIAHNDSMAKETIYDILDTPISPELLPPDEQGKMIQKTESSIGPYTLHDFFLYHFLRYGILPSKLYFIACHTFKDRYTNEEIKHWLEVFIKRFISQQFKRSCMPDGPKIGTIGLSPRGDLIMPSDVDSNIWLKDLENI